MLDFDKTIKEIDELVEVNCHIDAYVVGCEFLREISPDMTESTYQRMLSIRSRQERLGYLSAELSNERYDAYNTMLTVARQTMPDDLYKRFYAAF